MGVLGRLQVYVLTRTLAGLAAALVVISSTVMLISFVELSRTYGGRAEVGFLRLVGMMLLQAPSIILLLLPFIFLFGTMAAFVTLNRRSELIAMRAAGLSAWRFIFPAAGAAFLIGILDVMVLNPIAADLNGRYEDIKTAIEEGQAGRIGGNTAVWLRQGDEHTQIVIHAQAHDMQGGVVHLQGVSLFLQNVTSGGALQFTRRIEAAEARLDPGFWRLSDVHEATPGAGSVRSEALSIPSTLDRRSAMEKFAAKDAISFWRLPQTIERAQTAGFSDAPYRLRYQQLLATPLLFAGMSVLAAAFSLRLMRLGGLAGLAGAGVGLGFAIFFFDQLCGALGSAEVIPPFIAGWTPPMLALLAGFTLLCYTEDG
ncbi:MAG TPA: LptF/LptG family permease [Caulobacteraceae bacterium]|jgi:lipopolysaccharide export system permease protein|nr:LptF/LptG family permease [Caulobacteraceae bacterium]